jgi:hypothetical protein
MSALPIATHGDVTEDPIFGRERELARLDELVNGVPEYGAARAGDVGIGKSTLLEAARRRPEVAGMQDLRTNGVQSEVQLPSAGLHHLVTLMLEHADRLLTP